MLPYLIFTDLDGTLLGHYDYSFEKASKALETIEKNKIPLILNSSKTEAEISDLREKMKNKHPFIVENGAAVIIPDGYFSVLQTPANKMIFGPAHQDILWRLELLKRTRNFKFKSFSDFSVEELAKETSLSFEQAKKAKQRHASEPLKWLDDDKSLELFKQNLTQHGLKLIEGGRFFHVMGHNNKALAMSWLVEQYQKREQQQFTVIAAGDSPNDKLMLEQADIAAVIKKFSGEHLSLEKDKEQVFYSTQVAPEGFQETMQQIFQKIQLEDV